MTNEPSEEKPAGPYLKRKSAEQGEAGGNCPLSSLISFNFFVKLKILYLHLEGGLIFTSFFSRFLA